MQKRLSNLWNHPSGQVGLLLAFCFALYFINLGQWDLWSPDEPRYAQVAREMVDGGDWILMHFNGKMYADKPPLFFWLIAFSSYLWGGFTSFAVRFPSAFFGTLAVLLTFLIGKRLYSSRTGFISGLVLASSNEFAYLSTRANIDATLTIFTTASFFCFIRWYKDNPPSLSAPSLKLWSVSAPLPAGEGDEMAEGQIKKRSRENLFIYGFYVCLALATLAKGPVGFILPLLVCLVYLIIQRDWKGLKRMKLLPGMILFFIIILSWYIPALLKGGKEYFNETIMLHTVDRFAKGSSHIRPFYYYLYNFPADFLPWIIFLPAAIAYGFSEGRTRIRREFLFLLVWFAVIFIFFSLSKGKRGLYLLPLFPAVSLMVGKLWDDFISASTGNFREGWVSIPLRILTGLILIAGAAIPWVVSAKFPSHLGYNFPISFMLVIGAIALFVLNRLRYRAVLFFLIVGIVGGGFFYTLRTVFPLINPYKSARFISQEITSRIQPGETLAIYGGFITAPYNFYTGIVPILEIEKGEELDRFLQSEERVFCLLKFRNFLLLQKSDDKPEVKLIARRQVGGDDIVLISNK
jgi:4-amino-4-deoxy-L-arabinose transferase-like glycosyltransferase